MFNRKKDQYIGYIDAGNIIYYVFGQDDSYTYMSIYTDKDISLMFYGPIFDMLKSYKVEIHGWILKDNSPSFYVKVKNEEGEEIKHKRAYHINMNLQRFNTLFENEKIKRIK